MSKCQDCHSFYLACNSIGQTLSAEAMLIGQKYPSLSKDNIMQNITEFDINDSVHRVKFRPYAIAAGIVLALVLSLFFMQTGRNNDDEEKFEGAIAALTGIVNPERGEFLSSMIEKPMKTEFQNIIVDTKSAANFLLTCVGFDIDGQGRIVDLNKTDNKDPTE
ncbi:MAG: hypothetical protein P8016_04310 [Sedimentisphaerales bacterium]